MVYAMIEACIADVGAVAQKMMNLASVAFSILTYINIGPLFISCLLSAVIGFMVYGCHGFLNCMAIFGWFLMMVMAVMCSLLDLVMLIMIESLKLLGIIPGSADISAVINAVLKMFKKL